MEWEVSSSLKPPSSRGEIRVKNPKSHEAGCSIDNWQAKQKLLSVCLLLPLLLFSLFSLQLLLNKDAFWKDIN